MGMFTFVYTLVKDTVTWHKIPRNVTDKNVNIGFLHLLYIEIINRANIHMINIYINLPSIVKSP